MISIALALALAVKPNVLKGHCLPMSMMATGSSSADLDRHGTPFHCDTAIVTDLPNGRTLVQFARAGNDHAKIIGFGGVVSPVRPKMEVDHLYLDDGNTLQAGDGQCEFQISGRGAIRSITCGARLERGDIAVAAVVGFEAN